MGWDVGHRDPIKVMNIVVYKLIWILYDWSDSILSNVLKCLELISYVESIMLTDVCMYGNIEGTKSQLQSKLPMHNCILIEILHYACLSN